MLRRGIRKFTQNHWNERLQLLLQVPEDDSFLKELIDLNKKQYKVPILKEPNSAVTDNQKMSSLLPVFRSTGFVTVYDSAIAVQSTNIQILAKTFQSYITNLVTWLIKWKILPNANKTDAVFFTRKT
ncbi:hypothetical protein CEXT_402441 [Caerostris extrusa]|uniref:Uncharacterized protein n=1 Tax=Caerostris extrusa TaxID=172846 RepID=A0AAV4PKV5_CAEEX|nr:hypothetical protein CEXT_402441 [Caerostris extrusa]